MSGRTPAPPPAPARREFLAVALAAIVSAGCKARDPRAEWVEVRTDPPQPSSFDTMRVGVRQHLDRNYTYDVIPAELVGGLLYQGLHRPPAGFRVTIALQRRARVHFFFHHQYDGGYTRIFSELPGWKRSPAAPQYDLAGGDHGLKMNMFAADLEPGAHAIPPTRKEWACFSIVFDFAASG